MLWTIAIILFVLWLLGFVVFHVTAALIHLLLIVAIIVIVYNLVDGNRSRV
jgi:hypothetical protein